MTAIKFSEGEKAAILPKVKMYLREELDVEIGNFDAEFLLDFFSEQVGAYYYNRGLYDAQAALAQQLDTINEAIYQLEKPTEFSR